MATETVTPVVNTDPAPKATQKEETKATPTKVAVPPVVVKAADKAAKAEPAPTVKAALAPTVKAALAPTVKAELAPTVKPVDKVEAKTEPIPTPEVKAEDTGSTPALTMEQIKQREAEYVKKELARKQEIEQLQAEKREALSKLNALEQLRADAKKNPLKVIKEFGLSYEELTEAVLLEEQSMSDKDREIKALREEMEARFAAQEKAKADAEKARIEAEREAAVTQYKQEISSFLTEKKEAYPHMLALYDRLGQAESPESLLYTAIEQHFEKTGEMVELHVMAEKAEEWFKEQWQELNSRFNPKAAAASTPAPLPESNKVEATPKEESPTKPSHKPLSFRDFKAKDLNAPEKKADILPPTPEKKLKKDRSTIAKALSAMDTYYRSK